MTVADAYSVGAGAWARGPMRVYGKLAELLVARTDFRGRDVLDLGSGTGAVSRAAHGARVVAVDVSEGMLHFERSARPPGVVGDAVGLPFRDGAFDVVVAAFSLNHLADPTVGVREAGRVCRDRVLLSTYAPDDDHPVKSAVETALGEAGWVAPDWYATVKGAAASWGTVELATDVVERAGLVVDCAERLDVPFPELTSLDLVHWRLGMAHCADFAATHDVERRALELLGECAPLVRSVAFVTARVVRR